ncbi:Uncharacterized protein P5673_016790 [Acropora cervicornis]|uniref:Tricalbin-1 n=1 Tax=Acropora cervicornis TaxID=6130 RepID=A0AAD9QFP6_ACRCE|nr:Uncharacterized protein P5673_016790 [Acropora cervicornis]
MTQRKDDGNNAVTCGENSTESKQSLQSEQGRTPPRKNQQQRLIISLVLFTVLAWVLGRCEAGFLWIFLLLVWMLLWWNNNAARIIELAAEEVENDLRRKKAQTNSETAEWLNFLLNRWMVFSDRSLFKLIKSSLDPVLQSQKPSFVGSVEVLEFTLGNRTPYIKHVTAYDNHNDLGKLKATELNFNHPPDDMQTRGKYRAVVHLEAGLTSPDSRFIIRMSLSNKGFLGTHTDVALEDLHIHGKIQLELLFNHSIPFPHLAAVRLCFTEEPKVSFNIRLLKTVQLMEFPLLSQWINQMVNDNLKLALVDPGHISIPFCDDPEIVGHGAQYACGVLTLSIRGGGKGKLTDDPHWCSIKINGQKRYTGEETGEEPWTHHVSLLVYHLHADQLVLKLKGRRKLGTKYTIAEHLLKLSTLCLDSNRQQQHILEKSFRPATLTVDMEYTPLPVIDVSQSKTQEDFNRNYSSRIQNAHPDEVSGVLLVCAHSGNNLIPMDKNGLSDPYCVIYANTKQAKQGEAVKATLNPEWDTMVELLVADYTQTTLSFVVLDKDTPTIKVIKDDRGHFMGSCNLSLTEESPALFKKNLDLLYKVKGSGMMKAGKLCVSAIFRPVPSVAKSEIKEPGQGLPEGEPLGPKDAKTETQTLEALLRSERGTLEITIFQGRYLVAKDVNGKSDPFVKVKEGSEGKEKFRTRTIDNTLDPVWNETATIAMLDTNGLLLLEVWDKDPLTQERMGQLAFTTEKLKDLGKAPYEKHWYRLRGVKSGELQLAFKYTSPKKGDDDKSSNNGGNLASSEDREATTDDTLPTERAASSPFFKKPQREEKNAVTWGGTTQYTRTEDGVQEHYDGDVFTVNQDSTQFPATKQRASFKLKDWGSKGKRLRNVVESVLALRRDRTSSSESTLDVTKKAEAKAKSKPRTRSSFRKKFASLKERRQRSVSDSNLGSLFRSRDDMDPLLWRQNRAAAICDESGAKNRLRRSSEDFTGVITLDRNRNLQTYCISLPNSPVTTMIDRSNSARFVGARPSSDHSTASCSSNSRGSSRTQLGDSKSATRNFDVLILGECHDCKDPRKQFNSI